MPTDDFRIRRRVPSEDSFRHQGAGAGQIFVLVGGFLWGSLLVRPHQLLGIDAHAGTELDRSPVDEAVRARIQRRLGRRDSAPALKPDVANSNHAFMPLGDLIRIRIRGTSSFIGCLNDVCGRPRL